MHKKYFIKEMRIVAYSQFLESYKTVTIKSMAQAFGVSAEFIDKYDFFHINLLGKSLFFEKFMIFIDLTKKANFFRELSDFIANRRLSCKIDKVMGIVESERIDERNGLYQAALKQGDFLLNRIQKLSRVADIS